jgi:RES domain-containing protein
VIFWRISNHLTLTGDGAVRASGRWHTRGRRVVYGAPSPSAALIEILVHSEMNIRDLPARYRLLKIEVPPDVLPEQVPVTQLPPDWIDVIDVTRAIGDAWLASNRSPLLAVPSAVVPETYNILLNPAHPEAPRIVVVHVSEHVIDPRLLR